MAGQAKLLGAARSIYQELLARFGPNPTNMEELVRAAAMAFASRLGVSVQDQQTIAQLVVNVAKWESDLQQIPASSPGEQSYGLFQLNTSGKGSGYTPDELLSDPILNAVIAADYLVKLAKAGLAEGGPEEAARRMVLGGQTDSGYLGGQAPRGSGIVSGSPQPGESEADAKRVKEMINFIGSSFLSMIGFPRTQETAPQPTSRFPSLDDYREPGTGTPDWSSYMQAVALWVEPYVYAGQALPPGAPTEAHMVYDMISETRGMEQAGERRADLASYIDALVSSLGADIESRRLTLDQATLEFDRRLKAAEFATTAWENAMQWSIPPGAEYVPGYEPGGFATEMGMEPWRASPIAYNPFETAAQLVASTPTLTAAGSPDASNLFAQALALVQSGAVAPGGGAAGPGGVPAAPSPSVPGAAMGTAPVTPDVLTRQSVPINPQWLVGYQSGTA